jgi:hypothetical protein
MLYYRVYSKLSKCAFHVDTISYLGFKVIPKGIEMEL